MVEDVRLDEKTVFSTLQREDIPACGIHQDHFRILPGIEVAVSHDELVIMGVQVLPVLPVLFPVFRLVGVQPLVRVPHLYIECGFLFLVALQVKGLEGRTVTGDIFQYAYLIAHPCCVHSDERPFLEMRLHDARERTGLHLLPASALQFLRRE